MYKIYRFIIAVLANRRSNLGKKLNISLIFFKSDIIIIEGSSVLLFHKKKELLF